MEGTGLALVFRLLLDGLHLALSYTRRALDSSQAALAQSQVSRSPWLGFRSCFKDTVNESPGLGQLWGEPRVEVREAAVNPGFLWLIQTAGGSTPTLLCLTEG